jgi:hypothetical protein
MPTPKSRIRTPWIPAGTSVWVVVLFGLVVSAIVHLAPSWDQVAYNGWIGRMKSNGFVLNIKADVNGQPIDKDFLMHLDQTTLIQDGNGVSMTITPRVGPGGGMLLHYALENSPSAVGPLNAESSPQAVLPNGDIWGDIDWEPNNITAKATGSLGSGHGSYQFTNRLNGRRKYGRQFCAGRDPPAEGSASPASMQSELTPAPAQFQSAGP